MLAPHENNYDAPLRFHFLVVYYGGYIAYKSIRLKDNPNENGSVKGDESEHT